MQKYYGFMKMENVIACFMSHFLFGQTGQANAGYHFRTSDIWGLSEIQR